MNEWILTSFVDIQEGCSVLDKNIFFSEGCDTNFISWWKRKQQFILNTTDVMSNGGQSLSNKWERKRGKLLWAAWGRSYFFFQEAFPDILSLILPIITLLTHSTQDH